MSAGTLRWRGLHLPRDPVLLPDSVAQALTDGKWQDRLAKAAFALARPDDTVVVAGTGAGQIVALLAGKLGLPRVIVVEDDPARRAHVAAIARLNGLPRLMFADAPALTDHAPTLLFADLAGATPLPRLAGLPDLRAAVVALAPDTAPPTIDAVFAAAAAAGLTYAPALSSGTTLVIARDTLAAA